MKELLSTVAIALLALTVHSAHAEENNLCPHKISVNQTLTGKAPDGWLAYASQEQLPFQGISFYRGTLDQKALLAPSKEQRQGKNTTATWALPNSDADYWIACEYAKTSVVIAKSLGKDARICSVEYDGRFSQPVAKTWRCLPTTQ